MLIIGFLSAQLREGADSIVTEIKPCSNSAGLKESRSHHAKHIWEPEAAGTDGQTPSFPHNATHGHWMTFEDVPGESVRRLAGLRYSHGVTGERIAPPGLWAQRCMCNGSCASGSRQPNRNWRTLSSSSACLRQIEQQLVSSLNESASWQRG